MISRYNRRPVSHKLEIRGLSRSSLDHHPLPEEADDNQTPPSYLHDLQEAASAHNSILGTQLLCPSDEGFQWYTTSGKGSASSRPSAGKESGVKPQEKDREGTELNVQGRRAHLIRSNSPDLDGQPGTSSGIGSHDKNRMTEIEGQMEEYLAFDSTDLEDDQWEQDCSESSRRHKCLPPVSPYRCRCHAVLDLLFDDVWRQLIGCMKELVQHHWECCTSHDENISGNLSPVQQDFQNPFMLLSTLPTMLPKLGQSRVPPLTTGMQFQNAKSRGSKHKSRRKSKKQKRPSSAGRVPVGAAATQHNLNDLIVIHSIPLQQRNLGVLDRSQEPEERASHRPGSSAVPSNKPRPRRPLEQSSSSLSCPAQSARRRNPPPRTLLPLVPNPSQSSAVGSMDEVIRGTRLPTASDQLTTPPLPLSRNTLLPPISTGDPDSSYSGQPSKTAQRQKGPSSRAHSAINDKAGSSVPRDRHHLLDVFSRPNTTHTYRSDTPYRRSFTVLDNIGQGRPGRASVGTDSLGIGVTGISLGISSSSFLDSFSHHPLGHSPIKDEEEPDPQAPVPAPLVPASVPSRSHTRGGISSRASRPGL
ncbi:unnamed protein product [Oreochromis niloticus]|nr:unnamed protein product [Mustela putorius furo]